MILFNLKFQESPKKAKVENGESEPAKKNLKEKKFKSEKKFATNKTGGQKFLKDKNGKPISKANGDEKKPPIAKKDLKEQRRKQKLAGNYDLTVNTKKIWETLRR